MNYAVKILIGLVILLAGLWTMIDPAWFGQNSWIYGLGWWSFTWDIIKGSLGPVLIFIGIVFVWITYEESKV